MSNSICAICQHSLLLVDDDYPGYQEPHAYSIYKCQNCDTNVASPLSVENSIYDLIYKQADHLPGYYRYSRYAEKVLSENNPLNYLASKEEMYWGVKQCLEEVKNTTDDISHVLEIGSGLGYLTYSLNKSGINARGIDISETAVDNATKKYGDLFLCKDIYELSEAEEGKYSLIIMTEVLEHIPDPISFVTKLTKLLKVGGTLFITTPNKSYFDGHAVWETDAPPIHLWWFSRKSIEYIAEKAGCTPHFILMDDHRDDPDVITFLAKKIPTPKNEKAHILNKEGSLNEKYLLRTKVSIFMSKYGVLTLARQIKNNLLSLLKQTNTHVTGEDKIICARLIKRGE
jgi:SAM-dependent methyltransferase